MTDHLRPESLSLYMDRRLGAGEHESAESHLESCPDCARELEHLENLKVRLSALPSPYAPPQLVSELRRRFLTEESSHSWLAFPFLWKPLGALAILGIAGTLWFGWQSHQEENYVDMDALLAAHSKYQAEGLIPQGDFSQSDYSARLASFYRDEE